MSIDGSRLLSEDIDIVPIKENDDRTAQQEEQTIPKSTNIDKFYIVFILFYVMGTLPSIPQHFFITAYNFWNYKFREPSEIHYNASNKTQLQTEFYSTFNTVSTSTSFISLVIAIRLAMMFSIHIRMLASMVTMLIGFVVISVFTKINTDLWQFTFYIVSMVIGAVLNAAGSCFNIPLYQLAGKFPPKYLAAIITGQSICGTLAALIQILTIATTSDSEICGFIYFAVGAIIVLFTTTFYLTVAQKSPFFRELYAVEIPIPQGPKFNWELFKRAFSKVWAILLALILIMGETSMLHPGVTSLIVSTDPGKQWNDVYFVPVTCYLSFNVFDFLGRELARKFTLNINPLYILAIGVLRLLVLVPCILLCNIQQRKHIPVVFESDYVYIVLIILFAISYGYFQNLCILRLPTMVAPEEIRLAFLLLLIAILTASAVFSYLSVVIVKII